jgi:predicted transcriptional regulator
MSKKWIVSVDSDTGEVLEGVPVWVGRKTAFTGLYGTGFYIMAQSANEILAKDKDLTLEPMRVLHFLMSRLDFENFIQVPQTEICEQLEMKKPNVSKAVKLLVEKGIIIRGPKVGHSSSWRLNPNFGYKGNPKGKVYRMSDGRAAFRVVDGGKAQEPASERDPNTPDLFEDQ